MNAILKLSAVAIGAIGIAAGAAVAQDTDTGVQANGTYDGVTRMAHRNDRQLPSGGTDAPAGAATNSVATDAKGDVSDSALPARADRN